MCCQVYCAQADPALSSHVFPGKEVICGWQRYDAPGTEGVWKRLWARCVPVGMLPGAVLGLSSCSVISELGLLWINVFLGLRVNQARNLKTCVGKYKMHCCFKPMSPFREKSVPES